MAKMTRLERKVARVFKQQQRLAPHSIHWGGNALRLIHAELQAVRRIVRQYRDRAPLHSNGNSTSYRKACDDILLKLEGRVK